MPKFKKSRGFKMKGPQFFGSAMKKYGEAPMKDYSIEKGSHEHPHSPMPHKILMNPEDPENSPRGYHTGTPEGNPPHTHDPKDNNRMVPAKKEESPNKGLKDMLGKVKDKLSGGVGAGAGIGAILGGPMGALIGGGIGAIRKRRKAKKAEAAEAAQLANQPQAAAATNPEFAMSGMPKKGNKRGKKVKMYGDEYVKGGRAGDKVHKATKYDKAGEGTYTKTKAKKTKSGEIKTKTKTISAKKAEKQMGRKDRTYDYASGKKVMTPKRIKRARKKMAK
jgi:hypothetical protein